MSLYNTRVVPENVRKITKIAIVASYVDDISRQAGYTYVYERRE